MKKGTYIGAILGIGLGLGLLASPTTHGEEGASARIFDFKGDGAMAGWGKTATVTTSFTPEYLGLRGKGYDSKLYRGIKLPAGYYNLSACGKGRILNVTLRDGWD